MNRLIQILLITLVVFSGFEARAQKYPKPIQKRIDKAIKQAFAAEEVSFSKSEVSADQIVQFPDIEKVSVYQLKSNDSLLGYATFASSKGKNDLFDYLVLFDEEMIIKKVVILVYRSSYGGEIMAKYWLKQFEGKYKGEQMVFEKDIDSISGATISAPAITKGIKSLSLLMVQLKEAENL
ncbi:FMN-binding protein [Marinifilum caeruleilacunae]|uniref:FMN-binding protein n=1 Tax=Marinifilum caeruleilacunae TaxID=2499076 RepID=A0ABX1WZM4_9BACT|nr:FMN-binding protein [Marinifilum caeruleilacunae]NOU61524.1 FMN-binding protein [Marinifilum caeruleilacunae]